MKLHCIGVSILVDILSMATSKRITLPPLSSPSPRPTASGTDLFERFYSTVNSLRTSHDTQVDLLQKKIQNLETENQQLRRSQEDRSSSIFDIDYVTTDASTIQQLKADVEVGKKQIDALQLALNQQYTEYEDMKSKYSLQRLMNENHADQQNTSRVKDLESKLQQIKEQIRQFDQSNYESEEQIRLLKQVIYSNEQPAKSITQSLTVKQSDLSQQTTIVENLLNKQQEKILARISEIFDRNCEQDQHATNKTTKLKKKRL